MSALQVLMVDDEPDIRLLVRMMLDGDGIRVLEADSAAAAMHTLEREPIDAVVLDWMMPGTSGIEVLRRLRQDTRFTGIRVVMLTGISEDRLPEAVDAGADWIVTKPFDESDLLEAIRSLFPPQRVAAGHRSGPDTWIDLRG